MAAAGGNLSASNQLFMQTAVVNYLQQQGAGYLGQLVSEGSLKEGTPLHATLHGLIAATGAAACGQAALSSAAGAAASSLLTQLFSDSHPEETQGEQLAKRNLITSLVTGIATMTSDLNPAAASSAASAATDNNWLASQQMAQMRRELNAAETLGEELKTLAKWSAISGEQTLITMSGIADGVIDAGIQNISGLVELIRHPITGLEGIRNLISDPEVRAQAGEQLHSYLVQKIDNITTALREGGRDNAWQLGHDIGEVTAHTISAVTGAYGAAKGCVALGKVGIKLGTGSINAAKVLHAMDASKAVRQVGTKAAQLSKDTLNRTKKVIEVVKKGLRPGATKHRVVSQKNTGVNWNAGIQERGLAWENYYATQVSVESRLPAGFKVYDFYDETTKVATSAKSLDTATAAKIANPKQIYHTMKRDMIDPIIDFREHTLCKRTVKAAEILHRELQLAIPKNTTPAQWVQINRGIDYAQLNGIYIEITLLKP
ncbi:MAG: hypothetical protein AAHH96_00085 [Candidatus Symbiodolus clandestinus]